MPHGTTHMRLGEDSVRPFEFCCLGLCPPRDPVVTPDGFLFEREAVLENLLLQKQDMRVAKLAAAAHKQRKKEKEQETTKHRLHEDAVGFAMREDALTNLEVTNDRRDERSATRRVGSTEAWLLATDNVSNDRDNLLSFRSMRTLCPMSRRPLKSRDLRPVKFTRNADSADTVADAKHRGRYMCPVCSTTLKNISRPAVLPSGTVLCGSCIAKFVKHEQRDPVTGQALSSAKDIIYLRSGGTAFAASGGEHKEAKQYNPSAR